MNLSVRSLPLAMPILLLALCSANMVVVGETIEVGYRGCVYHDAIVAANTNQPVGNCEAGDPGHDHIYIDGRVEISQPPPTITEALSFVGDRATSTVDGRGRFHFMTVGEGVDVHLQDFFLTQGYGTRETGQIRLESGARLYLNTVHIRRCRGVKEIVAPADTDVLIDNNSSVCGRMPPFNPHLPVRPPGLDDDDRPSPKRRARQKDAAPRRDKPAVYTCEQLPDDIVVRAVAGTRSGIQCQAIDAAGVGRQDIIGAGIISAVDVWGFVEPGVEVCLRGSGSLLFLDAAFAPRQVSPWESYPQGDMTCATIYRPGSLVLISAVSSSAPASGEISPLTSCQVRTTDLLNFRAAPADGEVLALVPAGAYYTAVARAPGWFQIVTLDGAGWVSADYVKPFGDCA